MKPFVICHMNERERSYPDRTDQTYPREPWFAQRFAPGDAVAASIGWRIVLDAQGKIAWGRSAIGGEPIVVALVTAAPPL
jgi:hypothetical protein